MFLALFTHDTALLVKRARPSLNAWFSPVFALSGASQSVFCLYYYYPWPPSFPPPLSAIRVDKLDSEIYDAFSEGRNKEQEEGGGSISATFWFTCHTMFFL